jgi:hypothetical protein
MEKQLEENRQNLEKQQVSIAQLRKLREDLLAKQKRMISTVINNNIVILLPIFVFTLLPLISQKLYHKRVH